MKWKVALTFTETNKFGKHERNIVVAEDNGTTRSKILFSATFVDIEMESAYKIVNEIIIPALNESELKIEEVCG